MKNVHHGHARLNESTLLHAEKAVLEQITLGLHGVSLSRSHRLAIDITYLELPKTFGEVLAQLHLNLSLRDLVLAKFLTSQTFLQLFLQLLLMLLQFFTFTLCYYLANGFAQSLRAVNRGE